TSNFTVKATDSGNPARTATKALSIVIVAQLQITTSSLANGTVGQAYSQTLSATGGSGSYTWSVSSGSLPPRLSLNASTGACAGTRTAPGTCPFPARVADGTQTATKSLSIVVSSASTVTISTSSLPQGRVGVGYSATLSASGGTAPYSWS